uniref:FAD-binding protein n=1 Tax=Volvariella volvacea TaxID=36659 RepID=M9Z2X5_9AGAR|nr:FAD-binding protein [Volvariella volvacea]
MLSFKFSNLLTFVALSTTLFAAVSSQDVPVDAPTDVANPVDVATPTDVPVAAPTDAATPVDSATPTSININDIPIPTDSSVPENVNTNVSSDPACEQIAEAISAASEVFYPGVDGYAEGIKHWATSSVQQSSCVVEPGTPEDVAAILNIIGQTRSPFAVKGGGHTTNPGFSSTTGVQIAMTRMKDVAYDPATQIATVGAGALWDDVYAALDPHGVNVPGGRVMGVGVAGFTLGGGYSWKTNQHGLTLDNVAGFDVVKPTGEIAFVSADNDPELFSAIKGGLNNFGIVTVWGGFIIYTTESYDALSTAHANFAQSTDPKASLLGTYSIAVGQHYPSVQLFYDGPEPPPGTFDAFLELPAVHKDVGTRSYLEFMQNMPSAATTAGTRGAFHTLALETYSKALVDFIAEEATQASLSILSKSGVFVTYVLEPFLNDITTHAPANSSAYPFSRSTSTSYSPFNIYWAWTLPNFDDELHQAIQESAARIEQFAVSDGQASLAGSEVSLYPNYALGSTPAERIWGPNLAWMTNVKQRVDPQDVMGLAGGFKVPVPGQVVRKRLEGEL